MLSTTQTHSVINNKTQKFDISAKTSKNCTINMENLALKRLITITCGEDVSNYYNCNYDESQSFDKNLLVFSAFDVNKNFTALIYQPEKLYFKVTNLEVLTIYNITGFK
jgi:hypothetical protein